jgi:hypothetical protein
MSVPLHIRAIDSKDYSVVCDTTPTEDAASKVELEASQHAQALLLIKTKIERRASGDNLEIYDGAVASTPAEAAAAVLPATAAPLSPAMSMTRLVPRTHDSELDVTSPDAFQRVIITDGGASLSHEQRSACALLARCLELRAKHVFRKPEYYFGALREQFQATLRPDLVGGRISSDVDVFRMGLGRGVASDASPVTAATPDASPLQALSPGGAFCAAPPLPPSNSASSSVACAASPTSAASADNSRKLGMFYRRRPEPSWKPFTLACDSALEGWQCRMINGVAHVFDAETMRTCCSEIRRVYVPNNVTGADKVVLSSEAEPLQACVTDAEVSPPPGKALFRFPDWDEWLRDYVEITNVRCSVLLRTVDCAICCKSRLSRR